MKSEVDGGPCGSTTSPKDAGGERIPKVEAPPGQPASGDPRRRSMVARGSLLAQQIHAASAPQMGRLALVESLTSRWKNTTEKMVVQLVEQKADLNVRLEEPWDPAFYDYKQSLGATALHFASRRGLLEAVRAMLDYRADVNAQSYTGTSPLMVSVMFSQVEAIQMLLGANASALMLDKDGFSAVDMAHLEGNHEVIRIISEAETVEERRREQRMLEDPVAMCSDLRQRSDSARPGSGSMTPSASPKRGSGMATKDSSASGLSRDASNVSRLDAGREESKLSRLTSQSNVASP